MGRARIIHISDLHLFVDADGNHRQQRDRALTARFMARLGAALERLPGDETREKVRAVFGGLDIHTGAALDALLDTIDELLHETSIPTVVVQTGDMSTFGALTSVDPVRFPEWDYWQGPLHEPRRRRARAWVDLFGNHDVWPGTLPILGATAIDRVVSEFRRRHFPERMPRVIKLELDGIKLEFHRINSVLSGAVDNTWAWGELVPDVVDATTPEDPRDRLDDVRAHAVPGGCTLRMLLMHHPPHHFDKPGGSERGLRDAERLSTWLGDREPDAQFQLVLAGHRHAVDPPVGVSLPHAQPPLSKHTLQMVCATPTQLSAPNPSFSVYELEFEGDGATLARSVYIRKGLADRRFKPMAAGTFELSLAASVAST
jgi:3',5'-cyclic AMP phosphodiesterase CpdA